MLMETEREHTSVRLLSLTGWNLPYKGVSNRLT